MGDGRDVVASSIAATVGLSSICLSFIAAGDNIDNSTSFHRNGGSLCYVFQCGNIESDDIVQCAVLVSCEVVCAM